MSGAAKQMHTPGPWSLTQVHDGWAAFGGENGHGHPRTVFQCRAHGRADAECSANARLIAAAPDLLEALDWLLASVTADPAAERHPDDKAERLLLACGAARQALSLAFGRAAQQKDA